MITFLAGFALACFMWSGVFLWLDKRCRTQSVTKHARRDQHEFVHRKYRDAEIVATVAQGEPVEPIYMYGVTGCERD